VNSLQPRDARTTYLNGQTPEKKAEMITRADQVGPGKDDADWLVALASFDAAKRIEAAAPMTAKTLEAIVERLDRIEQRADDAAKQPALPADLSASMARLAEQLRATSPADPFSGIMRYVFAFVAGALVCEAAFFALGSLPPVFDRVAMFTLGLSATAGVLLYLWLAPIVRAARRGR
jgi:hypothetical protein